MAPPVNDDESLIVASHSKAFFETPFASDFITTYGSLWVKFIKKRCSNFLPDCKVGFRVWTDQFHDLYAETDGTVKKYDAACDATPDGSILVAGIESVGEEINGRILEMEVGQHYQQSST